MEQTLEFRKASPSDLDLLTYWDEKPHVIASDPNDDWSWEEDLAKEYSWCERWIAELNGRPLGFLQIIDPAEEESHYWGNMGPGYRALDIWIGEEDDLGKGHGTRMMTWAINRCFQSPDVQAILLDPLVSNVRAHQFYERLGFRFIEERVFGEDRCRVYQLDRPGND